MLSRIGAYLFSTKQCPQHSRQVCCAHTVPWGVHSTLESKSAASSCHPAGTPQLGRRTPSTRGACCLMVLLNPGSAAGAPAVLGWSSPSTAPTLPVWGQPRVVILMLHPGRRRPWLASGAHVKNMLNTLRQAQQSRPGSPTDRCRSSLPHGKAFPCCRAPLPPAWCTAGAPWARSGPLPAAVRTHGGRPTASLGTGLAPPP